MKIGIITLPLHTNYGGIIQAFVLQQVLFELGHRADVVTKVPFLKTSPFLIQVLRYLKRFVYKVFRKNSTPVFLERAYNKSCARLNSFVSDNIRCKVVSSLRELHESDYEVLLFGSDQVWRPQYAKYGWGSVENVFAGFAKNWNVKKIAYAASFGVDKWEFSKDETRLCMELIRDFAAISVRESAGVRLCKEYLLSDADLVLDPTLLWEKKRYCDVCRTVPQMKEKVLFVYVLNDNDVMCQKCNQIAKERGLTIRKFSSDENATLTIQEWLAMFRDASYVVTDSFHGTVFSIIFEKEFECVFNSDRGNARFENLLSLYKNGLLEQMRDYSMKWLQNALKR